MAQLNHIGVAVSDLPKIQKLFQLLGLNITHVEKVPSEGVTTYFIPVTGASQVSYVELLEVSDPESTVAKFIQKRGPGIHHLAFSVGKGELLPLSQVLQKEGYRLIYPDPKPGAHGTQVNFIHPQSAGGLLVEVVELASS